MKKIISLALFLSFLFTNISFANVENTIFDTKAYAELRKDSTHIMTTYNGQKYIIFDDKSVKILNLKSTKNEYVTITNSKGIELLISMVNSAKKNNDFVVPLWTESLNELMLLYYDEAISFPLPGYDTSKFSISFITKPKEYLALINIKDNSKFKYEIHLGPLWRESVLEAKGFEYIKRNKYLDTTILASLKSSLVVLYPKSNIKVYQYLLDQYSWKYSNLDKENYKLNKAGNIRIQNLIDQFNFLTVYTEGDK